MDAFLKNGKPFPKKALDIKNLAQSNIGKNIYYVMERDIDKSGRGYYSISSGKITGSFAKNIQVDGDWIFWREIREYSFSPQDKDE
mgnify:CR=1 FL=1